MKKNVYKDYKLCQKLFVYGTLKRGKQFSHHLTDNLFQFEKEAVTLDSFSLLDLTSFPAMINVTEGLPVWNGTYWEKEEYITGQVKGEIFHMPSDGLILSDKIECYPYFYTRTIIETDQGNAWCYFLNDSISLPERFYFVAPNEFGELEWN